MKLFLISLTCLVLVLCVSGESTKKNVSLTDRSDFELELKESEAEPRVGESQRKRDSGYSYSRPGKYAGSQRLEPLIVRGRIVRPNAGGRGDGGRPFSQYGPPRFRQSGGNRNQQELHITLSDFAGPQGGGVRQRVPSPIRGFDFVEPSPIAGQNNVPFNTNTANYLPPQNQKLPSNAGPYGFSSQQNQATTENQALRISQSQNLLREPAQPQISDAAAFLTQNSQAISQLYETPASNQNQEPFHEEQGSNANFENFRPEQPINLASQDASFFRGTIPSYSSGILNDDALQKIKSLEKDRLINQLQHALVENRAKSNSLGTTRYAQNHENHDFTQSQSFFGFQGQINPSAGPQLDRPSNNLNQRPYGTSAGSFIPLASTPGYNYGPPSTTPPSESPSSTLAAPTIGSTSRPGQNINGEESSQSANSIPPPSNPPSLQIPQFGGFVPSFINTNYLTNYPAYGTNFLASGTSTINQVQSSSPTQFGIPIPAFPVPQGTTLTSNQPTTFKPQSLLPQNPQQTQPIPVQPINPTFPLVPAATPIQPVQNPVTTLGHPNYGLQPTPANPLILKPIKPLYPLYYYPNVYQIQKPGLATLPWTYAPSYSPVKPDQAWK